MPQFKVILQYTQPSKGFEEVFYVTASSLRDAANLGEPFLISTLSFRHSLTVLSRARVSSVDNNRQAVVVPINRQGFVSTTTGPDVCATAAVCNLVDTTNGATRHLWLRGLNDIDVARDPNTGRDVPSPGLDERINGYMARLEADNYQIRSLKRVDGSAIKQVPVVQVAPGTQDGTAVLKLTASFGVAPGGRVNLYQCPVKQLPGINGQWSVLSYDGVNGLLTIRYRMPGTATVPTPKATIRNVDYNYGRIRAEFSGFSFFSTRDTGRNPLGGRGAKRAVHLRSL
jgi:hypothetical protein